MVKQLDEQIVAQISQCQTWQAKQTWLKSVLEVSKVVATTLLALLPELGQLSTAKISTLVGVALLNRDSRQMQETSNLWRSCCRASDGLHGNPGDGAQQSGYQSLLRPTA